ncbi:MAG: CDP-archaeol synthase [Gammaproteobacteria bacterium]|nr:MAG: CDP-archaeol synthase [Gammaproteobacteria bacterium]
MAVVTLTLYLVVINGAPLLARRLCGPHFGWPLDAHCVMPDGQRLLGESKTWRGLLAGILAGMLGGPLVGLTWTQGGLFGLVSLLGDALTSFLKRRFGWPPHHQAPVLDQSLEVLLPLWLYHETLNVNAWHMMTILAAFFLINHWLSPWLYRIGIRLRPW